jgi:copper homeostasis protein
VTSVLLEVCVDDAEGLDAAIRGGGDRIELCSALGLGGLTPSPGLMRRAATAPVPVYAMIRPRAGGFVFDGADVAVMEDDIDAAREAGLGGVVLGASRHDGRLDAAVLERLVRRADGLGLTLHRAFDLVPDFAEALEVAVGLGFERVLTSGGASAAVEGAVGLRASFAAARGRIVIMPGSGVTADNFDALRAIIPLREVHASCSERLPEGRGRIATLGFEGRNPRRTSAESVIRLKSRCSTSAAVAI